MTRTELLLVCLMEECAEVAQRASKALRFGLAEVQPGQPLTNTQRLVAEMEDLAAVWGMLVVQGAIPTGLPAAGYQAKREKVERYLNYSRECGTLAADSANEGG